MKINIASFGGRTHMLDTARELEKFGHEVRFYSFVPTKRAVRFGLKKKINKSYFFLALPFLMLQKITHRSFWSIYLFQRFFDIYVALIMPSCDIFIGQSPMHVFALKKAKQKYNAITIIERGASHIISMVKILETIPSNKGKCIMPDMLLKRDLLGYELADYISIASEFQKRSFLENGIPVSKLLINPYGFSLSQFSPTEKPTDESYDVIMVGNWSYQKGCDLIIEAIRQLNVRLLHVGNVGDVEFPNDEKFTHVDSVDQSKLINYYSASKIFVLPSRQDGFGMVLSQAMVCGLPIVCSKNTGGRDLINILEDNKWIIEMEEYSSECLTECISKSLELAASQPKGIRDYAGGDIDKLTWEAYGSRYNKNIERIAVGGC